MKERASTKGFVLGAILVALLLSGVVSYYASGNPDGLEYVAEEEGFLGTSETTFEGSPMPDYAVEGVSNERAAGGLAGVAGSVVVLLVAGGLVMVLRRAGASRRDSSSPGAG